MRSFHRSIAGLALPWSSRTEMLGDSGSSYAFSVFCWHPLYALATTDLSNYFGRKYFIPLASVDTQFASVSIAEADGLLY